MEVRVTPDRIDAERAVFGVELDNHRLDLTGDYTSGSTLTFPAAGEPNGRLVLRLAGLPAPVVLRWVKP